MKVLVCGLGSIGQRHVRNLRALRGDEVDILAFRTRGLPHVIGETMALQPGPPVDEAYRLRTFEDLDAALAERPHAVLVCNPTRFHCATALAAVDAGCHVLVEKPLSDSADLVGNLLDAIAREQVVAAVGFQQRFHPALARLRALLGGGRIGRVVSVRARMAEYLPDAHPYEDYRDTYPARADLGGGVINCYCHEFDYLCWIFGVPRRVSATGGRLGALDIDVEDTAVVRLETDVDGRAVPMTVELSFLERPTEKTCTVVGELGTIHVDLAAPGLSVCDAHGTLVEREAFDGFTRNQPFVDELSCFLAAIEGHGAPAVTVAEAAGTSLKVALAAHEALRSGAAVELA